MITLAHQEDRHGLKTVLQMANGLLEIFMPISSQTNGLVAEFAIAP